MMTRQKRRKGGKVFKRKRKLWTTVFFLSSAEKRKKKIMRCNKEHKITQVYPTLLSFNFLWKEKNGPDNRKETGLSQMGNHQETMWSTMTSTMEEDCCKYKGENNLTYLITENLPSPPKKIKKFFFILK